MKITALHIGKKWKLKDISKKVEKIRISKDPLIIKSSQNQYICLLKYGVVVFWGFTPAAMENQLNELKAFVEAPHALASSETTRIRRKASQLRIQENLIELPELNVQYISLISLVLGRSVALEYYEKELEESLSALEQLTSSFAERGTSSLGSKALLRKAGKSLNIQQQLMIQLSVLDKPDLTWESAEMDLLYRTLVEEYELEDRFNILAKKNETITHSVEFILDYINTRHSFWLEVIIILLILFEIIIFFFELWKGQ